MTAAGGGVGQERGMLGLGFSGAEGKSREQGREGEAGGLGILTYPPGGVRCRGRGDGHGGRVGAAWLQGRR